MKFGTAGIPVSAPKRSTEEGIKHVASLGLDAMELEFVRGVNLKPEVASKVGKLAGELGISLSVHAPYYINLNASDEEKLISSIKRIVDSARVGYIAGARDIVFHPAWYGGSSSREVLLKVEEAIKRIIDELDSEGIADRIILRPETMGGLTQFGTLEELLELSVRLRAQGIKNVEPCLDFAHMFARSLGEINDYDSFRKILEDYRDALGGEALKRLHVHLSNIGFSEKKGETRHYNHDELPEETGISVDYRAVLKALKDTGAEGVVISETPVMEKGALEYKRVFAEL